MNAATTKSPEQELVDRVEALGGRVRLYVFDGGQSVYLDVPGLGRKSFTAYWGEVLTAAQTGLKWLDDPKGTV